MNNLIYIFKNILFRISKEGVKLKRPTYKDLIKYENFQRNENNKLALSFAAGRSGQNWFSKIFNSHSNWIGSCERFADFEAFYRYVSYYNLPIYKEGFRVSSHNKSLENYIKAREKAENKKNLFLEKIADKDTTRDEMIENIKNALIANGWTYKEDK